MRTFRAIRRAFTLIEVVVAVGILAVVTIAIATVFDTVGKTVSAGSRLSTLNRLAFRIETIMGRDFEGLEQGTGFLVIRNEYAQRNWDPGAGGFDPDPFGDDAVPLFPGDAEPRLRRMDEIAFFNKRGPFRSRRVPLHPALVAQSREARIYYGHGQRMPRDVDGDAIVEPYRNNGGTYRDEVSPDWRFDRPRLDDLNDVAPSASESARLGQASLTGSFTNPNEFARDWLLVRHVTLLRPASSEIQDLPNDIFGMDPVGTSVPSPSDADIALARARTQDNSRQIALQPAAQSIFQPIAALQGNVLEDAALTPPFGTLAGPPYPWGVRAEADGFALTLTDPYGFFPSTFETETLATPLFTSGLVDIATTDLEEIRSVVEMGASGGGAPVPFTPFNIVQFSGPVQWYDNSAVPSLSFQTLRQQNPATNPLRNTTAPASTTRLQQVQQEWMLAALPSLPFDPATTTTGQPGHALGFRMRAERFPPNLYPPIRDTNDPRLLDLRYDTGDYPSGTAVEELMAAVEQADQEMLINNVFLPRCSEFIVEWSYGVIDRRASSTTNGQLIWHGLRRWEEIDNNGGYTPGDEPLIADLFVGDGNGIASYDDQQIRETPSNGFSIPDEIQPAQDNNNDGVPDLNYIDPRLEALTVLRDRANPSDRPDPDDARVAEYVWGYGDVDGGTWPWPTLIRITLRVADTNDPPIEQSYQVVFRVKRPGDGDT